MEKKYELLKNDTIKVDNHILYRIKALKDFANVNKGDLGGYIEKEDNLSQDENCWVYDDAHVLGNAQISGHAWVLGNACVYDNACVFDNARVSGDAQISGHAWVLGNACVSDYACVYDDAYVSGDAQISGNARVSGDAHVSNDANISSDFDYCAILGFGSEGKTITFFKCKNGVIKVNCGCFNGTLDEFRKKVKETHGDNKYAKEYLMAADLMELKIKLMEV